MYDSYASSSARQDAASADFIVSLDELIEDSVSGALKRTQARRARQARVSRKVTLADVKRADARVRKCDASVAKAKRNVHAADLALTRAMIARDNALMAQVSTVREYYESLD